MLKEKQMKANQNGLTRKFYKKIDKQKINW